MERVDWDTLFMSMVYVIAAKSKDQLTHIGAVVVGPNNEVRSVGYNSFPRNIDDDNEERQKRPEKYFWFAHAEANAIVNAALVGIPLKGSRLYTNGVPCSSCALYIINSGIEEVIVDKYWNERNSELWNEHAKRSITMFKEANVKLRYWEGDLLEIKRFRYGKFI